VGGIATRITITNKGKYDIIKNKNEVLDIVGKIIDITIYDIEEYSDRVELIIKKEVFENNIHDLIKEISPIMNTRIYFFGNMYKEEVDIKKFNEKNYPIKLKLYPENAAYGGKFYLNDGEIIEHECFPDYSYMLLRGDESLLAYNVKINIKCINIWLDPSNINEYPLGTINVLNKLTSICFKNPLSKSIFFYVD